MITIAIYTFLLSLFVLILTIFISHKHAFFMDDALDSKPQNYHEETTARAGGIGILFGFLFLTGSSFGIQFFIPVLLAFLSGIFEDFHNSLSPKIRLALQLIAASSAIWLTDSVVTYLGLGISMPYSIGVFFSVFAIVGMMNAINMIDGFNGLASGIILLILLSFAITSFNQENMDMFYIVLVSMASVSAFFLLNFPKGKIFLGDGGAYMLGFIVAIIGIFLADKYEGVSPWYILAIFIYPVWEVLFSIMRKLTIGLSPMQPDAMHFHMLVYRQITHNNPLTSLFIIGFTFPFMLISTIFPNKSTTNIVVAGCFILSYLVLYYYLDKKESQAR